MGVEFNHNTESTGQIIEPKEQEATPSVYATYAERFKAISKENISTRKADLTPQKSCLMRIWQSVSNLFSTRNQDTNKIRNQDTNFYAHVAADHLAYGSLEGNYLDTSVSRMVNLLGNPKLDSPSMQKIREGFELGNSFLVNYRSKITQNYRSEITQKAKCIKGKLKVLKQNESLFLPIHSSTHSMMIVITCTDALKQIYKIEQHNTGNGVSYHYNKLNASLKGFVQPLIIEGVPGKNLFREKAQFVDKLCSLVLEPETKTLYEEILPLAGGKVADPSPDKRYWVPHQGGGSCTASCLKSVLRCHLSAEEYGKFEEVAHYELFLKTYKQILSGEEDQISAKILCLEMIKEIQHRATKGDSLPLPEELENIKNTLEKMVMDQQNASRNPQDFWGLKSQQRTGLDEVPKTEMSLTSSKEPIKTNRMELNGIKVNPILDESHNVRFEDPIDNLNCAFTLLRDGGFTKAAIEAAEEYSVQSLSLLSKISKLNEKELNLTIDKLIQFAKVINTFYEESIKDQPLTEQEIACLDTISNLLDRTVEAVRDNITKNLHKDENSKIYQKMKKPYRKFLYDNFISDINERARNLESSGSLNFIRMKPYKIRSYPEGFKPDTVQISPEMEALKAKINGSST